MEKKGSVQIPNCRRCNGVLKIDAETQVQDVDIHAKVFSHTSIQCDILRSQ